MPQSNEVLSNLGTKQSIAEAVMYRALNDDDALFIKSKKDISFQVKSHNQLSALSAQGWTLCLDNLKSFLNRDETTDEGLEEAELIINWMMNQQ